MEHYDCSINKMDKDHRFSARCACDLILLILNGFDGFDDDEIKSRVLGNSSVKMVKEYFCSIYSAIEDTNSRLNINEESL